MFPDFNKIQEEINDFIESTNKALLEIIERLERIEEQTKSEKEGE